ncbi:MAG: hypothetical protein H0U75_08250 [Legionella sp.]|nr:hypothetical protein [Legionella sp.]
MSRGYILTNDLGIRTAIGTYKHSLFTSNLDRVAKDPLIPGSIATQVTNILHQNHYTNVELNNPPAAFQPGPNGFTC